MLGSCRWCLVSVAAGVVSGMVVLLRMRDVRSSCSLDLFLPGTSALPPLVCPLGPGTGDDLQCMSKTDWTLTILGIPELLEEVTLSSSSNSSSSVFGTVVSCANGPE